MSFSDWTNLHTTSGLRDDKYGKPLGIFTDWFPTSSEVYGVYYESLITGGIFRFFVPPGTLYVGINYSCQYNTMFVDNPLDRGSMNVQWKEECECPTWVDVIYYDGILVPYFTYSVGQSGTDMGMRLIANDGILTEIDPIKEGGWLYIWIDNNDANTSHHQFLSVYNTVDKEAYCDWYFKTKFDINTGDPLTFGGEDPVVYEYPDPLIKEQPNGKEWPPTWPDPQYPWSKSFPYPFGE